MRVVIIKYFFCLLFLLVIGCKHNDEISSIITSSDCYWDIHDAYSAANGRIAMCYKFNKDGSCSYLFTLDKKGKRDEYDDDDVRVPKQWKIIGDTIYIRGIKSCLISYSSDTILLENPIGKGRDTLVRNCK